MEFKSRSEIKISHLLLSFTVDNFPFPEQFSNPPRVINSIFISASFTLIPFTTSNEGGQLSYKMGQFNHISLPTVNTDFALTNALLFAAKSHGPPTSLTIASAQLLY